MNSSEIELELSLRMYRWATLDVQREVSQGYPFIRSIQNYYAQKYLQYVDPLSYEEQIQLATNLVKRVHSVAARHLDEVTTEDDKIAIVQYQNFMSIGYPNYLNNLRRRECENCVPINKSSFFKRIVGEIESTFKHPIERTGRFSLSVTVAIDSWFLRTTIELLSRTEGWPRYYQYILKKPEEVVALAQLPSQKVTNMLFWMGIHSETVWDTPFEIDTEPALKSLVAVCQHLASSLPDLLKGLEPSSFDIRSKIAEWKNIKNT